MTVRLVDAGWGTELTDALRAGASALRVICPFIKVAALDRLLSHRPAKFGLSPGSTSPTSPKASAMSRRCAYCSMPARGLRHT